MDPDGDKKIKISKREKNKNSFLKRSNANVSVILQSIRVRCCSIFPTITNREFMEGELRVVLYCGVLFWLVYLLYEIVK
jgi:hypothetical protein